ncbi:MAG TPA: acetate--CoA ligase family protein [Bryobacteraceae bacterium]|nr:acetate--CoA ligase family protein [Bryobacteraceae bacterium]
MRILDLRSFTGPNLYCRQAAALATVGVSSLPSSAMPGAVDALRRHGFLDNGVVRGDACELLQQIVRELARRLDVHPAEQAVAVSAGPETVLITVPAMELGPLKLMLETALDVLRCAAVGSLGEKDLKFRDLRGLMGECSFGPSTQATISAAERRGIPWVRLDATSGIVRLGWGILARTIEATISSQTDAVAVDIACNKDLTKRLLGSVGLPVPQGQIVTTEAEALAALRAIGAPVVVKPLDGNQGRGVSLNLKTETEVCHAFALARQHSPRVIVEQLIEGRDYRVLVVNGKMLAASEKTPAFVTGDGIHTVAELVDMLNADPRRGDHHSKPLSLVHLDAVAEAFLHRCGWQLTSIPRSGQRVVLRDSANLSTGGEARDVTDLVHRQIRTMCERASRIVGLNICGLDLVLHDISAPFKGAGGIIEVNAAPGLRMHQSPSEGAARDAGAAIINMLFPGSSNGRIPVIAVAGTMGASATARLVGHVLQQAGVSTGVASDAGITLGGELVVSNRPSTLCASQAVLGDPTVEAAVFQTCVESVKGEGLCFDWCDVAIFTHTRSECVPATRLLAARVRAGGALVLNADDPATSDMLADARIAGRGQRIILFSLSSSSPEVKRHVAAGGTACVVHGEWLELRRPEGDRRVVRAAAMPGLSHTVGTLQAGDVLGAIGGCLSLEIAPELIAAALMSFEADSAPSDTYEEAVQNVEDSMRVPA